MMDLEKSIGDHLQVLACEIGARPGGSTANDQAAQYIVKHFQRLDLAVEEQRFECPEWVSHETRMRINDSPMNAVANAYSPACEIIGQGVAVGTLQELEKADLHGKIGILYGDLTQAPLSPKSWFLKSEREDQIIKLLEEKDPLALITIQANKDWPEPLIEDWEFEIPSVTISREDGLTLLTTPAPEIRLLIDSEIKPGSTANVVARSESGIGKIVLCAHHDTKFDTPGALDNGSGVAVLMALGELLRTENYPFQLEFVSFANEEYMPIGDDEYLRLHGEDLSEVILAINVDGAGLTIAPDSIAIFSSSKKFEEQVVEIMNAYPGLVWTDPWPESNHSTFAFRGVPSLAFTSVIRTFLAHHENDTLDWLDPTRLGKVVSVIKDVLDLLATKPTGWTRGL